MMMRTATHRDVRRRIELTGRQRQVIDLLAAGCTNAEIGDRLGISLDGAKWHVSEIIGKLAVSSREEAVARWREYQSPGARLSRAFHGLFVLGSLKWAAGAAGVVAASAVSVAVVVILTRGDSGPSVPADTVQAMVPVDVFLLNGEDLAPVRRLVPEAQAAGRAALEQLFAGPDSTDAGAGLGSTIPAGTRLLGLAIEGGVATVNVSSEFESGGGSLSMQMRLAQVVYTLTQFPTVEQVVFQIEGETVDVFSGEGIVLDGPVGRAEFEEVTQAIVVESPANWETVTSPLRITGTANTFEAMFWVQVLDGSGAVLAESPVMATSGSGTRGTFDFTLPFTVNVAGPGSIVVFEHSAQDGSVINRSETRVFLEAAAAAP